MTNGTRSTDLVAMQKAMGDMTTQVEDQRTSVNNIVQNTESLGITWTGAAANGFRSAIEEWQRQCNGLLSDMQGFINDTHVAGQIYQAGEDQNKQSATGLGNQMSIPAMRLG